jgi:hypothetical protein
MPSRPVLSFRPRHPVEESVLPKIKIGGTVSYSHCSYARSLVSDHWAAVPNHPCLLAGMRKEHSRETVLEAWMHMLEEVEGQVSGRVRKGLSG